MTIKTLPFSANCYIVFDDNKKALLIDPAERGNMIYDYIKSLDLDLEAVFVTHAHFDHIAGLTDLISSANNDGKTPAVYIHKDDEATMRSDTKNLSRTLFYSPYKYTGILNIVLDEDKIVVGDMCFAVLHAPGHTVGCACLINKENKKLFSGDVLFDGSIGRCDFDGGNMTQMRESLKRLMELDDDYVVYPGHGGTTTIGNERNFNPYIAGL